MSIETIRIVSWNINRQPEAFDLALSEYDVALLQEVPAPSAAEAFDLVPAVGERWATSGWGDRPWRTVVGAATSSRVTLEPVRCIAFESDAFDGACVGVSRPGTIAAADLRVDGVTRCTVASVYAAWESVERNPSYMWADGSAHRLLSDLEPLILRDPGLPVIVAGDWNIYRGYGEPGWQVFGKRYRMVFERAELIGLTCKGPDWPGADRRAAEPPAEMPDDSPCVPTYYTRAQGVAGARNQLDFVFATPSIADRVTVRARNSVNEWGPSDHCRVEITVQIQ